MISFRLLFLSVALNTICLSQNPGWVREYPGFGLIDDHAQMQDGSVFIVSSYTMETRLMKLDSLGIPVWQKALWSPGPSGLPMFKRCAASRDGNLLVSGSGGNVSYDFFIEKRNLAGNVIWNVYLPDGPDNIGGPFIESLFDSSIWATPYRGYYLSRVDAYGNLVWNRDFFSTTLGTYVYLIDICESVNGDKWILGQVNPGGPKYLIRLDLNGNLISALQYTFTGDISFEKIKKMDTLLIVAGTASQGNGYYDVILGAFRENGNVVWLKQFTDTGKSWLHDLELTPEGKILLSYTEDAYPACIGNGGNFSGAIVKFDRNGNLLMKRNYGKCTVDIGGPITICNDSSYLFSLAGVDTTNASHYIMMKIDTGCTPNCYSDSVYYPFSSLLSPSLVLTDTIVSTSNTVYSSTPTTIPTVSQGFYNTCSMNSMEEQGAFGFHCKLYPNPTERKLYLEWDRSDIDYVKILEVSGRSIFSFKCTSDSDKITLDVSHLAPGIYFVYLQSNVTMVAGKFIKE